MMVERLQGYRMDVNNPNTKGFAPGVVRELLDHIAQLEAHKAESMQVFASLQIQAIAKEIGAPLGSGAPEQILPWIKATKAQLEAQADESSATMERLSGVVERYRGGVLPSSAERCALRWSHSSATDRGSFDRGWEAREAEGIEAQRGGSDLVELIRRRYPRMLERGNPLYDAVLADAVQRGGAVVVPAWNRSDFDKVPPEWSEMQCFGAGYELAASRIQPIPAGGALADGMVGVDREEWEVTSALALRLANWYNGHEINRTIWPPELQRYRAIHALRSAKGGEG